MTTLDRYVDLDTAVLVDAVLSIGTAAREGKVDSHHIEDVLRGLSSMLEILEQPEAAREALVAANELHGEFNYAGKFEALQDEIEGVLMEHEVDTLASLSKEHSKLQEEVDNLCTKFDAESLEELNDNVMQIPDAYSSADDVLEALHRLEKLKK